MTATITSTATTPTSAEADFEVTFWLASGQHPTTRRTADSLRTAPGDTREQLADALWLYLAFGLESKKPWTVTDTTGRTWLFHDRALLAIEIRDPAAAPGSRPLGFKVLPSD